MNKDFLRRHLIEDVMPFWTRHAVDWERGGLFTCISDDGKILRRDKYIWSNTRALWTFSALCRRIEPREEWRRVADGLFQFLKTFGRDAQGYWVFVTTETGQLVEPENSIVVDAFAILGLVEYFRLTGNEEALTIARETSQTCRARLARPGTYKTAPYPTPAGMKPQREAMQFSLAFCELGHAAADDELLGEGLRYAHDVVKNFFREDDQVLLEYLGLDNSVWDTPAGRAMVPGHAIETLWFQIQNFRSVGDTANAGKAARAMRCAFEKGWDAECGGLLLGIDVKNGVPPYWKHADKKLWWPHTEALCGALLADEELHEPWCLDWYRRTHEWAFAHFPDREHGEWTQRLDRQGRKVDDVVALPVKDPFHLPRGLIVAIERLERHE